MDIPIDPRIVDAMSAAIPEFRAAYEPNGLSIPEFDTYGATRRTLRQFLAANNELETLVRDVLVPNPDK
jgi:transaldolase